MYWDISLHIDEGRDPGPLANPAHYFILAGLFGIFIGRLPGDGPADASAPGRRAVRITRDWYAPARRRADLACGAFSLIGFPLDDIWHRLFGQDVTLWGPTHLMLIGGAAMTLVGRSCCWSRACVRTERPAPARPRAAAPAPPRGALAGAFLVGLSTFQAEFDFGVPQFRFVFQPMLIMLAAGVGLVAARLWAGRGGALGAVGACSSPSAGCVALLVGPVLGETTPHFPLYVVEALVVEPVALPIRSRARWPSALWPGMGIGTVGLAAEWGWSHVWMPIAVAERALPRRRARLRHGRRRRRGRRLDRRRAGGPTACRARAACAAGAVSPRRPRSPCWSASPSTDRSATGSARGCLADRRPRPGPNGRRRASSSTPPTPPTDAEWLTVTAWQGGGLVRRPAAAGRPGRYRTTKPIPVHGEWKALIRLHRGNSLSGVPIYLPRDQAIPAKEVPAAPHFSRDVRADHDILQRELRRPRRA